MDKISFKNDSGYSLIEVLIALLVLSIGLLGMAGLQATSLRYGQDAHNRSAATILAYDIIERIHTNRDNAAAYVAIGTATCSDITSCCDVAASSVANDMACWSASLQRTLPAAVGTVADAADDRLNVTITWLDRENVGVPFSQSWIITP